MKTDTDTSCHFCWSINWSNYLQVCHATVSSHVTMHNIDFNKLISVNYLLLLADLQDVKLINTQV